MEPVDRELIEPNKRAGRRAHCAPRKLRAVSSPVYFWLHTNVTDIFCVAYSETTIPLVILRIRFNTSAT
jgi:hypothetical protein